MSILSPSNSLKRAAIQSRLSAFMRTPGAARGFRASAGLAVGSFQGARNDNQDRALVALISNYNGRKEKLCVALVCDGMGGLEHGAEAATIAASIFVAELACGKDLPLSSLLEEAVAACNDALFKSYKGQGGTTLTALVTPPTGRPYCVHIGDSRLFCRTGSNDLKQISKDDTLEAYVNASTAEEGSRGLLQFVGMGTELQPHIFEIDFFRENTFILTTDGAHFLGGNTFQTVCKEARTAEDIVRRVTYVAEVVGAKDNATITSVIPSRLAREDQFSVGESVVVWSPWDKLDIWLVDQLAAVDLEKVIPKKLQERRHTKAVKTPSKKTKQKKKGAPLADMPSFQPPENGEPQVQIVFGPGGAPNDRPS